jgi:glycosyltransferase involved in cell wall biosynthesis
MASRDGGQLLAGGANPASNEAVPLVIASILPTYGSTGVHTHIWQLRGYLDGQGISSTLLTSFSWGGLFTRAVFAVRLILVRVSGGASVFWYRHWHEFFLRMALRRHLARLGDCVIYAQGPLEARAALRARSCHKQRVVMVVHFKYSHADEWTNTSHSTIKRNGKVFRWIRRVERDVIPQTDGLVYVSRWARSALQSWLPEAATVRSAVIGNFVAPMAAQPSSEPMADLVTIGGLDTVKNHRFLLEVLAEAKRLNRSVSLDMFGDGPLRGELTSLRRSLGLDELVRFRGFQPDVRNYLPGYRAYVHASYSETSSLAIMEAMAAGLPVVVPNIGPMPELCTDHVEGRFWPLDDPAKAAAILLELLDDAGALRAAADAARERFRRVFAANVVGPRLYSFIMESRSPNEDPRTQDSNGTQISVIEVDI